MIGAVQSGVARTGLLLLSLYGGVLESLESLLFGSILGVTRGQVLTLELVGAGVLAFLAVAGRPLFFASVDGPLARASRVPVRALSVAFLLVLGLAVAATAQMTGVLLVFALLVAPAAIARELTARIGASLVLSVLIGLLIAWLGLGLSYFTNYSAGLLRDLDGDRPVRAGASGAEPRPRPMVAELGPPGTGEPLMPFPGFLAQRAARRLVHRSGERPDRLVRGAAQPGVRRRRAQPRGVHRGAGGSGGRP